MKMKSIVAFVENKKGDFWQVALVKDQQPYVSDLIKQLHGGTIKILNNKLPLEYQKKEKNFE